MKVLWGLGVASAGGSVGGHTASRNRYGPYLRLKGNPVNPNTTLQSANRARFAQLSIRWQQTLTDSQRQAWKDYADNMPMVPSSGGPSVILSAQSMYIRCNLPRMTAALTIVDDGPTTYSLCELTDPVATLEADSPGDVTLDIDNTDEWATAIGGALLVFTSRQVAPTINFFKGPYQFAFAVLGAVIPPTSPATGNATLDWAAGNNAYIRLLAVAPDGRISNTIRVGGLIA